MEGRLLLLAGRRAGGRVAGLGKSYLAAAAAAAAAAATAATAATAIAASIPCGV